MKRNKIQRLNILKAVERMEELLAIRFEKIMPCPVSNCFSFHFILDAQKSFYTVAIL